MAYENEHPNISEAIRRIREGNFYEDYDYASGPGLRSLALAESLLVEAATRFREYEKSHRAKIDPSRGTGNRCSAGDLTGPEREAWEKATRNGEIAYRIEKGLLGC